MNGLEKRTVEALDKMQSEDPEAAHVMADRLLLDLVDAEVVEAYERLVKRCRWWGCG